MANTSNLKPFSKGYDSRRGSKPKGSKHLSTLIREMVSDPKFHTYIQHPSKGYEEYSGPAIVAIINAAIIRAVAGDYRSMEWIAKNGWGKPMPEPNEFQPPPKLIIEHVRTYRDSPVVTS